LNKALLDTEIYSEAIKATNRLVVSKAVSYRQQYGKLTISVISVMEIVRGFQQNQNALRLQSFLAAVSSEEVLIFDQPAAELAGRIEGELLRLGRPIGIADTMIAALAVTRGIDLVTGNTVHFQRVQQLGYSLALANWRI
jgi:predicted nucleic acid-binding protein